MGPRGFTLSELLIALVILGVIATFTIPKVLTNQQDAKFRAIGKEVAGMISGAHQAVKFQGNLTANTNRTELTPYFNYVRVDTTSLMDAMQTQTTNDCSSVTCLVLHNGGVLYYSGPQSFNNTASTNAVRFFLDPDGKVTNGGSGDTSATAQGKSVRLYVYFDGKIRSEGIKENNTCGSHGCDNPTPSLDPPWFGWN